MFQPRKTLEKIEIEISRMFQVTSAQQVRTLSFPVVFLSPGSLLLKLLPAAIITIIFFVIVNKILYVLVCGQLWPLGNAVCQAF